MERFEERELRFEGEIEIREGKRIEEWNGNRSKGIAHHSSQTSNLKPQISTNSLSFLYHYSFENVLI